jgi:vancomycin resistance protein YoaR
MAGQARERELAGLFDPAFLAETRKPGGTSVVPRTTGDGPDAPRSRRRVAVFVTLAGVGAVALLWVAAWFLAGAGVAPGTSVLGVDIGGMSRDAAEQRLRTSLGARAERPVQVSVGGREADLTPGPAGIRFDAEATVANAGGRDWRPTRLLAAFFGADQVDPVVTVDRGKFDPAVTAAARGVERPAREGGITFTGTSAEPVAPVSGTMVDRAAAAAAVETAFLRSRGPIVLPMQPVQPRIGRDEVERAMREFAEPALSGPVTVTAGGKSVRIPTRRLAPALSVRPGDDGRLVPVVDGEVLSAAIRRLDRTFEQPPKDATIKIVGGRPQVVAGEDGRTVDPAKLAAGVLPALTSTDDREVEVELGLTKPKVTTEQIAALGIREQLSTFRQKFPYAPYRVANIGRAARYIEGTILEPGELFSMNDTIRERTEANGYVTGIVIEGGRFRRELGGGVSIITTAMWTAAFYAGLERVEQRAHSLYISRYRAGLEATVSYGNLDLRFRNNTPHAILITTKLERSGITVTMWGTKVYDKIVGVSGPRRNLTTPRVVYDPKPDCEPQDGVAGFDITVTRLFYKGGVVVKSEPFETHYDVTNEIRCGAAPKDHVSRPAAASRDPWADNRSAGGDTRSGPAAAPSRARRAGA